MESLGDFDQQLYFWVSTGIGLCLIGLANLFGSRLPVLGRVVVSAVAAAVPFGILSSLDADRFAYRLSAAVLAAGLAVVGVLQTRLPGRVIEFVRRPAAAWGLLLAVGVGVTVVGIVRHERAFDAAVDRQMEEFNALTYVPEREFVQGVAAVTDRGYAVPVAVAKPTHTKRQLDEVERRSGTLEQFGDATIKLRPWDVNSNCHGWVFTGGRYIVGGDAVDAILQDNGYVPVKEPGPGDIAVYRADGEVTHTGLVRYVGADRSVVVESKWGWMGVFLHAADKSCYGTNYTYYHTARGGNLLKGIESPAVPLAAANEPDADAVDE
jgi:hypothetical protein